MQKRIEKILNSLIPDREGCLIGLADLSGLLDNRYAGFDYGIVIGRRLDDGIIDSIGTGPNIEYYKHYYETNRLLSKHLAEISKALKSIGVSSVVIPPTVHDADLDDRTLKYSFSHKMAATRAGLGWIGKTALFVSEEFGPRVRLGTVLIDCPVKSSGSPIDESRCGGCNVCVDRCPAGAASGRSWKVGMAREDIYDPFKCWKKCLELSRKNIGKDESLCGICVSVCPVGKSRGA